MEVFIGFDISLQSTHICAVDADGSLVRQGRRAHWVILAK